MNNLDEIPRIHLSQSILIYNQKDEDMLRHLEVPAYDPLSVLTTIGTVIKHSFGSRLLWVS